MYDEISRRFLNFARSCINDDSPLVRFIALHGIHHHAKTFSFLGHNVWLCSQWYKCPVDVSMSWNSNSIVHQFIDNLYDTDKRRAARFVTELLLIREGKHQLHNNDSRLLSHNEVDDIIVHICISYHVISCLYNFLFVFGFMFCTSCTTDYNKFM
jgi:hypothetical protein